MTMKKISILTFLRNRMIGIVILLIGSIICLTVLALKGIEREYDSQRLINILGRQRMLTQRMAKDAVYLYTLQTKDSNEKSQERRAIAHELRNAMDEFDLVFDQIYKGIITVDGKEMHFKNVLSTKEQEIMKVKELWYAYRQNLTFLIDGEGQEIQEALQYVMGHNEELLSKSDGIIEMMLQHTIQNNKNYIILAIALAVIVLIVIMIFLYQMYHYLFLPLEEIYRGAAEVSVTKFSPKMTRPAAKEFKPIIAEVNDMFLKLHHMITLIENLNQSTSFQETLEYIYASFSAFIPYTYIGIGLIEDEGRTIRAAYGMTEGELKDFLISFRGSKVNLDETSLRKILDTGKARIINDLEVYCKNKPLTSYNQCILEAGIRSSITLPLKINEKPVGIIFFSSTKKNIYKQEHIKLLKILANSIAISLQKNIFTDGLVYSSILSLAKLAESRDTDTGEHLARMQVYARVIGELLVENEIYADQLNIDLVYEIERFSPLHDIGKVAIRDDILLKPGKLTHEEFDIMKTHTTYGEQVLCTAETTVLKYGPSLFRVGVEIAAGHHEKWDGSGYPYGKSGEAIPISARIVALADVFDALMSKRPYKDPFSLEQTFQIIEEGAGKHFDPEIVRIVLQNKHRMIAVYNEFHSHPQIASLG